MAIAKFYMTTQPLNTTQPDATNNPLPSHIDLDKWQDLGFTWSGVITPNQLPRLVPMLHDEHLNEPINLVCTLEKRQQLLTFDASFAGDIWMTCQRCLEPMAMSIEHHISLPLVAHDEQLSLLGEDDDYLMLDEIVTDANGQHLQHDSQHSHKNHAERYLPLAGLVEDELLLAVPLSPKHEDCDMAVTQVGEIEEQEPDNPFAQLQALKGKL